MHKDIEILDLLHPKYSFPCAIAALTSKYKMSFMLSFGDIPATVICTTALVVMLWSFILATKRVDHSYNVGKT